MNSMFQANLINPTHTRNTGVSRDTLALRILERQGATYTEWVIGEEIAAELQLQAGDRVSLGFSEDGQAGAIGPHDSGWKLVRQGKYTLSVQIKADKLGMDNLPAQSAQALNFIRYDRTLVIDTTPLKDHE